MNSKILSIQSSGRLENSITRQLSEEVISQLQPAEVSNRDLSTGLPFINEGWIGANFTAVDERTAEQNEVLALSNSLVDELSEADVLVLGVPIYNFGVPAVMKAWIDMVARVGRTFRYTENGPVGLLEGKRAVVLMASGGTSVGSDIDFASGYVRHVLGFIGISDVTIIAADSLGRGADEKLAEARAQIAKL